MKNILFILFIGFPFLGLSQRDSLESAQRYTRNTVHISAGTWFFYGEWNLNYERIFTKLSNTQSEVFLGAQFGFGVSESFSDGTHYTPTARLLLLSGNSRSHFELNAGATINLFEMDGALPQGHMISQYTPTLSIGYRFQNMTNNRLIFRTGVGWPVGFYLGCGFNF